MQRRHLDLYQMPWPAAYATPGVWIQHAAKANVVCIANNIQQLHAYRTFTRIRTSLFFLNIWTIVKNNIKIAAKI
jgi:hypothetical protein